MPQALSLLLVFVYTKIGLDQKPGTISYVSAGTGVHLLVTVLSLPELTALCCHVILTPPGEGSQSLGLHGDRQQALGQAVCSSWVL